MAETPLPSQWDSSIIRQIAYAALALVTTVAGVFFGVAEEVINDKGARLIEAAVTLVAVLLPLFLAYRARLTKATPPITEQAVKASAIREQRIADAPEAMKEEASK